MQAMDRKQTAKAIGIGLSTLDLHIVIDGENLENCAIIGRVVAHIRKGVI